MSPSRRPRADHSWSLKAPGSPPDPMCRSAWVCPSCGSECLSKSRPWTDRGAVYFDDSTLLRPRVLLLESPDSSLFEVLSSDCGAALVRRTMSS